MHLALRKVCALALCSIAFACGADDAPNDDSGPGSGGATTAAGSGGAQLSGSAGTGGKAAATGSGGRGTPSSGAGGDGMSTGSGGMSAGSGGMSVGSGGMSAGSGGASAGSGGASGTGGDSDILEPAQGALLGVFYGDDDIAKTTAKLGRAAPVHLTYYAWDDDWAGSGTKADLAADRIPLVNWEPYSTTLDAILSGTFDAMLQERAAGAKALGKSFFLDFAAEMNGDWSPWSGADNGMSADKYVAAYRYIHDAMTDGGATNIVWLWCPNVTDEPRAAWNATLNYYPGDDYVDWTCVDGYNWGTTNGDGWQSFDDVFSAVYEKLATKNKPIMIGEMASAEAGGDKGAWIEAIVPALRDDFPLIKGLVWFDINKETDWRISSSPEAEAAFKQLANDAYFNP